MHTAERVPGRIGVDPEVVARLEVELRGASGQHPRLSRVRVLNVEVQVGLHGRGRVGPAWRPVTRRGLEIDPPAGTLDRGPLLVEEGDLATGDLGVEGSKRARVRAIDRDQPSLIESQTCGPPRCWRTLQWLQNAPSLYRPRPVVSPGPVVSTGTQHGGRSTDGERGGRDPQPVGKSIPSRVRTAG